MAQTRREYVFATFLSSCAALVLLIVAYSTNEWVYSSLQHNSLNYLASEVNYGLFSGTFSKRTTLTNRVLLDISVVCDYGANACAWSCVDGSEGRKQELSNLLQGGSHNDLCTGKVETVSATEPAPSVKNASTSSRAVRAERDDLFLNAGLWLSTVVIMALAVVVTAVAALLGVINTASNPKQNFLAIFGLYVCNGVAAGLDLICLILWGSHFAVRLKKGVGLNEVISGVFTSEDGAEIGWSFWLVLVACFISAANVCVLFWRDYLIRREPPPPTYNPEKEVADGTLFLY